MASKKTQKKKEPSKKKPRSKDDMAKDIRSSLTKKVNPEVQMRQNREFAGEVTNNISSIVDTITIDNEVYFTDEQQRVFENMLKTLQKIATSDKDVSSDKKDLREMFAKMIAQAEKQSELLELSIKETENNIKKNEEEAKTKEDEIKAAREEVVAKTEEINELFHQKKIDKAEFQKKNEEIQRLIDSTDEKEEQVRQQKIEVEKQKEQKTSMEQQLEKQKQLATVAREKAPEGEKEKRVSPLDVLTGTADIKGKTLDTLKSWVPGLDYSKVGNMFDKAEGKISESKFGKFLKPFQAVTKKADSSMDELVKSQRQALDTGDLLKGSAPAGLSGKKIEKPKITSPEEQMQSLGEEDLGEIGEKEVEGKVAPKEEKTKLKDVESEEAPIKGSSSQKNMLDLVRSFKASVISELRDISGILMRQEDREIKKNAEQEQLQEQDEAQQDKENADKNEIVEGKAEPKQDEQGRWRDAKGRFTKAPEQKTTEEAKAEPKEVIKDKVLKNITGKLGSSAIRGGGVGGGTLMRGASSMLGGGSGMASMLSGAASTAGSAVSGIGGMAAAAGPALAAAAPFVLGAAAIGAVGYGAYKLWQWRKKKKEEEQEKKRMVALGSATGTGGAAATSGQSLSSATAAASTDNTQGQTTVNNISKISSSSSSSGGGGGGSTSVRIQDNSFIRFQDKRVARV